MKFLWDKPRPEPTQETMATAEDIQKRKIRSMVRDWLQQQLAKIPDDVSGEDRYRHVIFSGFEDFATYLPEFKRGFDQKKAALAHMTFDDDTDFCEKIPPIITDILLNGTSFSSIEEVIRMRQEEKGYVVLSRVLTYLYAGGDRLNLHVPPLFTADLRELRTHFFEGLIALQGKLQTEQGLKDVRLIRARSPLIPRMRFPKKAGRAERVFLLTEAGFIVKDEEHPGFDEDEAEITVEKFLQQDYSKK